MGFLRDLTSHTDKSRDKKEVSMIRERRQRKLHARLTVPSPPRLTSVRLSSEKVRSEVSVPFSCAFSAICPSVHLISQFTFDLPVIKARLTLFGLTKLLFVFHAFIVPSSAVATITFPSFDHAHFVIFVFPPFSLLFKIIVFTLLNFSLRSQIRKVES